MNASPALNHRRFHGYKIIGLAAFCQFFAIGCSVYLFGLYVEPISEELNVSRALLGFGPPLTFITSSLLSPIISQWIDRDHTKAVMMMGSLCIAGGMILLSMTSQLWQMGILMAVLIGSGSVMLGIMPSSSLVINWFQQKRGLALGIASAGAPLGGVCLPVLVALLITETGWRNSMLTTGLLVAATITPAIYFLAITRPEKIGQFPDNDASNNQSAQTKEQHQANTATTKSIVLQRNFFALALTTGLLNFVSILILTTLVPYAVEIGLSTQTAALLFSVKASASFAGMFLFGYISDKINSRKALLIIVTVYAIGWPFLLVSDSIVILVLAVLLTGVAAGGVLPVMNAQIAHLFGRSAYARTYSLIRLAMIPIIISPAPLSGYVYDTLGSYHPMLMASGLVFPLVFICLLLLRNPEH